TSSATIVPTKRNVGRSTALNVNIWMIKTMKIYPVLIAAALFSSLNLFSLSTRAEVYRWVDEDGNVHYSDKKPKTDAEDITRQVSKQNIDTSLDEQRRVQQICRPENGADRGCYRQQQSKNLPTPEHMQRCNELRKYLDAIDGRVQ